MGVAQQTIPYAYGDSNWKDKLTAYNGQTITYDAIGNPLNDGTWTYEWQNGRQLKRMYKSGVNATFAYNHAGLRVRKTVSGLLTEYTLNGKLITHLEQGSREMHFFYDAQGKPAKFLYNGELYTYVHNLQGDIVGILDSTGAQVVEYKYDAWGKRISTTAADSNDLFMGRINPFRYRGYVYDEETGLYYIQNRYYASAMGRFLVSDDSSILTDSINSLHEKNCMSIVIIILSFVMTKVVM